MRYTPPDAEAREMFHQGRSSAAYRFLGAHTVDDGEPMWHFAVWAPNARAVSVTGEFCGWDADTHPMRKQFDGTWELRLPRSLFDADDPYLSTYKYAVCGADGQRRLKADPYAFFAELRPATASRVRDLNRYEWHDQAWMSARAAYDPYGSPVNIYELHPGTWRRGENGEKLSYTQIADQLIPYIKEMRYTHVEFLPVMEHPYDGSWGYQITGFYAPTSRYGEPEELMALIDRLHQAGIGVILDWVPAHFTRDDFGLRRFDGTACYEHPDPRRGDMPQWGTHFFDLSRGEVRSFLLSNADFWLRFYHADGLRCDAVSSMLYLDFARADGDYLPNKDGGNLNYDAVSFLQALNTAVYRDFPGVMMIAEESSDYRGVTRPVHEGGLGFGFKWNMGWMNDTLAYVALDPIYRKYSHDKLTFSLMYAFNEHYILPFSHDEVVHGKHSLLDKHPGDIWRKFAGLRALYGYTMAHPGKKLLFMGGEFGQFIEWKDDDQLDWFLLQYEKHPELLKFVRRLNAVYRQYPALYKTDGGWDGFKWLRVHDADRSVIAFLRSSGRHTPVVCVVNFTPVFYGEYTIGLPYPCEMTELLNSDRAEFAGSNQYNAYLIKTRDEPCEDLPFSATVCVPPLSAVYLKVKRLPKRARSTSV